MVRIPEELAAVRDKLIDAIRAAFSGVSRKGGVSWSQADVLDGAYTLEAYAAAGLLDADKSWTELIGNRVFEGCPSEWSFLDPIGYRYYLPACLITYLMRGEEAGCLVDELTLRPESGVELVQYRLKQWSLLDSAQCACIACFLQFMGTWLVAIEPTSDDYWREAYESYWSKFEDN